MDADEPADIAELTRRLGQYLADLRKASGAAQRDLARHTFVCRSYVSHAERGYCLPNRDFWLAADTYLAAGGLLCAAYDKLAATRHALRQAELDARRRHHLAEMNTKRPPPPTDDHLGEFPWTAHGAIASLHTLMEADDVDRRHFLLLTGGTLTAFAHDWLFDPTGVLSSLAGRHIGHSTVDGLDQVADIRSKLHDTIGGTELLRTTHEDLRLVVTLLREASYTDEVGRRLHSTAAEFARTAGYMAADAGQPALAQRYLINGLRAAHCADNRPLGAGILGRLSELSRDLDRPTEAVRLAESALLGAKNLTPAVAARTQGHLASAAALAGDATTADRAANRCTELTALVDPAAEPPWMYWWSDARAHFFAGRAALTLGQPATAEHHLTASISGLGNDYPLARARYETLLATARLYQGELDGACEAALTAADTARTLHSDRIRTGLLDFRAQAQPHATSTAIRDFDLHTADLLHPTST